MALVISALMTTAGRAALAKSFGGPTGGFSWSYGRLFKIGTAAANFAVTGIPEPLPPSPAYTDIQSVASGVYYYQKTLEAADILFISVTTIQFRCFLDLPEANGNPLIEPDTPVGDDGPKNTGAGLTPVFFELGIFDPQDEMVAYATFPGETKLVTKTLNHLVNINF